MNAPRGGGAGEPAGRGDRRGHAPGRLWRSYEPPATDAVQPEEDVDQGEERPRPASSWSGYSPALQGHPAPSAGNPARGGGTARGPAQPGIGPPERLTVLAWRLVRRYPRVAAGLVAAVVLTVSNVGDGGDSADDYSLDRGWMCEDYSLHCHEPGAQAPEVAENLGPDGFSQQGIAHVAALLTKRGEKPARTMIVHFDGDGGDGVEGELFVDVLGTKGTARTFHYDAGEDSLEGLGDSDRDERALPFDLRDINVAPIAKQRTKVAKEIGIDPADLMVYVRHFKEQGVYAVIKGWGDKAEAWVEVTMTGKVLKREIVPHRPD